MAGLKKGIYSPGYLADTLKSSNRRYIEFISAFDSRVADRKKLESISRPVTENSRKYKGFNFFSDDDLAILPAIHCNNVIHHYLPIFFQIFVTE